MGNTNDDRRICMFSRSLGKWLGVKIDVLESSSSYQISVEDFLWVHYERCQEHPTTQYWEQRSLQGRYFFCPYKHGKTIGEEAQFDS
jgi:hypothetical protein